METIEIIIPTYNASEGVVDTIIGVRSQIPKANIKIIDDNSPDRTAKIIKAHFFKDKKVKVFVRNEKGGRGSAIIYGFKEALKNKNAKYFIEMDADLCHDPKYIPKLVEKCKKYDLIVASRYVPGGKVFGWSLKRILMSKLINTFAKLVLQLPILDYTDGYRCYSRRAIEYLVLQKFKSKGYVVLSESAYLCYEKGFTLSEIPIHMYFKPVSKSNLTIHEIKEALVTLSKLRFSK